MSEESLTAHPAPPNTDSTQGDMTKPCQNRGTTSRLGMLRVDDVRRLRMLWNLTCAEDVNHVTTQ